MHGGQEYRIGGRRDRFGYSFWLEQPPGKLWRHISRPVARSSARVDEIVAAGSLGAQARGAALASGWFAPTGRMLRSDSSEPDEIWALTTQCAAALRTAAPDPRASVGLELVKPFSQQLTAFLSLWVKSALAPANLAGVAVLGPAPFSDDAQERVLLGAYPEVLKDPVSLFTRVGEDHSKLVRSIVLDARRPGWHAAAAAHGYQGAVQLSIPAVAGRTFECLLFFREPAPDTAGAAALAALNAWPDMRRALVADSPLTERELECLRYTAAGYTAEECALALGCTEANVRHHLKKSLRRLGAPNSVAAIQRTQMLGVLQ